MFYSLVSWQQKLLVCSMEGMSCPLEARGRGPIECFINCAHYVSVVKELVLWCQVSLASCMCDESSANPTMILRSFYFILFIIYLFVCVCVYVCMCVCVCVCVCVCLQVPEI